MTFEASERIARFPWKYTVTRTCVHVGTVSYSDGLYQPSLFHIHPM